MLRRALTTRLYSIFERILFATIDLSQEDFKSEQVRTRGNDDGELEATQISESSTS